MKKLILAVLAAIAFAASPALAQESAPHVNVKYYTTPASVARVISQSWETRISRTSMNPAGIFIRVDGQPTQIRITPPGEKFYGFTNRAAIFPKTTQTRPSADISIPSNTLVKASEAVTGRVFIDDIQHGSQAVLDYVLLRVQPVDGSTAPFWIVFSIQQENADVTGA